MMESRKYSDIGSWWERKKGKEANEIAIAARSIDGKMDLVREGKRQQRNYDHKAVMEKVDCIKTSIPSKYQIDIPLDTPKDM